MLKVLNFLGLWTRYVEIWYDFLNTESVNRKPSTCTGDKKSEKPTHHVQDGIQTKNSRFGGVKFLLCFVRLHDDGRIRWPKHVAAKYNKYIILIVLLFGYYWYRFDKNNEMFVPKLEVKSVHALNLEGHCAHLSENLKLKKCTKLCYISPHLRIHFCLRDKHRLSCLQTRSYAERKGSTDKK